jgi:dTDP-4-amino-4,6-dideoxygalactose transaminase
MGDMTHALTMALQLAGVGKGDEVLTLAYNCLSSNSAITAAGACPVWVDIDPASACLSLEDAAAAMTPHVKALVLYHVAGYPADVEAARAFCDRHGIALIEDANNALGAHWDGRPVGTRGDFGVFSFYANRQVNGIEGAALACTAPSNAVAAARLRRFGIDMSGFRDRLGEIDPAADVPQIGMSSPLNHVNATLARQHLRSLQTRLQCNRDNVARLQQLLSDVPALQPIRWSERASPAFWTWLVRVPRRDAVMALLKAQGIQCSKLHQPNSSYSGFGARARHLPGTERFMHDILALPCGWWLSPAEIETIAASLRDALTQALRNGS